MREAKTQSRDESVQVTSWLRSIALGIDYKNVAIPNFAGRPVPIVDQGDAISELAGAAS